MTELAWAAEITMTRPSGVVETTRVTDGAVPPFPHSDPDRPNAIFRQRLAGPPAYSVGVSADVSRLAGDVGGGVLALLNGAAEYSWMAGCAPGTVEVRRGRPGAPWAEWAPVLVGRAEAPRPTLSATEAGRVEVPVFDRRALLNTDVETRVYGGTNSGTSGYDGTPEAGKGDTVPLCIGRPLHVPGTAVNTVGLAWQYDAGPAGGMAQLYDRGDEANVALVATGNPDAFDAAGLTATQYVSDPSRGLLRMGGALGGELGIDPIGRVGAGSTAPEAVRWLLSRRSVGSIGDSLAAWTSVAEIGAWWGGAVTYREVLELMARSEGAAVLPDALGRWQVARLDVPGAPVDSIADHEVMDIAVDDPDLAVPVGKVTVLGQRNHLLLARDRQAQELRNTDRGRWLAEEFRRAVAVAPAVNERYGDNARKVEIVTALTRTADMEALANRLLVALGPRPDGTPRQSLAVTIPMSAVRLSWRLCRTIHLRYLREGIDNPFLLLGMAIATPERHLMRVRLFG